MKISEPHIFYEKIIYNLDNLILNNKNYKKIASNYSPWIIYKNSAHTLPTFGLKIHVSSKISNLLLVSSKIAHICSEKNLSFKICKDYKNFLVINRGAHDDKQIGKIITIYLNNNNQCEEIYNFLGPWCEDQEAPKICTDLYLSSKDSISFRYGNFVTPEINIDAFGRELPQENNIINKILIINNKHANYLHLNFFLIVPAIF
jgi:hypothetical protein